MRKAKKTLLAAACACALVVGSVAGTVAYLTSQDSVTNTFTMGDVKIELLEHKVDDDGKTLTGEGAAKVRENSYKVYPGGTYDKDPTVYVGTGSENCWLFVKIDNGLSDIEGDTTIETQLATNGWTAVSDQAGVYAYKNIVSAGAEVNVFEKVTISSSAELDSSATVKVQAYAVQADGFATSAAAWEKAPATWTAAA